MTPITPRPLVLQATLETGFEAPRCTHCGERLSTIVREMTPYILTERWRWNAEKIRWERAETRFDADPNRRHPVIRVVCPNCNLSLSKRNREAFYVDAGAEDGP